MGRPTEHGLRQTPEYGVYHGIKDRCLKLDHRSYAKYGGIGIAMCAGWLESVVAFCQDMKSRPSPQHTIDRIDNNGGYWCGHCAECVALGHVFNCRWATRHEQFTNRTHNRRLTLNNVTRCASEWADILKIPRSTFNCRLKSWGAEKALTVSVNEYSQKVMLERGELCLS